jgi:alpha-2-macroglobulin
LQDKSAIVEIPVAATDQPNFFVEAYTIYDGEYHQELREIFVPPAQRVVNVEVKTDKAEYLPGEEAEVEVMVTDLEGRPASGSCLIAVYDRSLEQIAADVLPDDIRKFFWQWRRDHQPYRRVNIDVVQPAIPMAGQPYYPHLGIFGRTLADDLDAIENADGAAVEVASRAGRGAYGGGAYFGGGFGGSELALAEGAMMMDAAPAGLKMVRGAAAPTTADAATPSPQVRKDFADTALWLTTLETGGDGRAKTNFKMPENLTSWKIGSWSVGQGLRVGSGETTAVTRKPLLLRLQMPRFLVDRDEVVLSAIVHNDLPGQRNVQVSLEIDGETQLELVSESDRQQMVDIASHQQARVDWRCRATAEGLVTVRASAVTADASDAMQLELPILINGILKTDSFAGTVRAGQASSIITVDVPQQRRIEQSRLTVRVSPSLAAAMIDALPYLNAYPYGCTEQTLNRFLPTVITQQTLRRMQIDLAQLKQRRNNLNAQELGAPEERRQQWETHQWKQDGTDGQAVYDAAVVDEMVTAGVTKLTAMQNPDGGWGWFSGTMETTTAHTTAVVIRGLLIAQENGVAIVPDVLQRGLAWLEQYQASELQKLQNADGQVKPFKQHVDNVDALVFHVLALADRRQPAMQQLLFDQREHLTTYGKALLAWATHRLGNAQQTSMLRRNIEQFLVEDAENETAFLTNSGSWWYWYGSEIEANALYLKLLSAVEPQGRTAPRIVKWLLNNRKHATYWNSTRDTALVVEAFADYMAATEELQGDMAVEVYLSGRRLGRIEFTPENLFDVDNTLEIVGAALPSGPQELEIRRTGRGNLYWNAYATNFTLQPEIRPAGLEVAVERRYYHLRPSTTESMLPGARANVVDTRQSGFERVLLEDLQDVSSGELVEVELLITSKNDYEYLVIEDRKAAGLEAVETQSGYFYTGGLLVYRELREQHIGLCIRWLPQGKHSIRYQLRSEAPGTFTALPAVIQGMYAPELRGNSADYDLSIID